MKLPKFELDDQSIQELAKRYRIIELSLFGSALRNDFSDRSDLDFLVVFSDDVDYSYFDLMEVKESLEKATNRRVDLIEKDSIKNPYRRKEILETAKVIYAA
jgi:predicted nucleotidyltransferase